MRTLSNAAVALWAAGEFRLPRPPDISSIRKIVKLKDQLRRISPEAAQRKHSMDSKVGIIDIHVIEAIALFEGKVHLPGRVIIALAMVAVDVLGVPAGARQVYV